MSVRARLVIAGGVALALAVAGGVLLVVRPWSTSEPSSAVSPFAVADRGAVVPFVEYEAEAATTNGVVLGPDRTARTLAGEASGRRAVSLDAPGEYVEFTLTAPASAMNVRLSVPDSSDGVGLDSTLSVYVDGADIADLAATSRYSWFYGGFPFTNGPADGTPHHFYDESRLMFDRTLPAGSKVRLQKDADDSAASYTVDLVDFEQVGALVAQPAGSLSVVDFGADPTGAKDSGAAIARAIAAGRTQGKEVWLPKGEFQVNQHLVVDGVTLRGAGMWYSVLRGDGVGVYGKPAPGGSTGVYLSDFAIFGEVTGRDDNAQVNGIGGAMGGGSVVANLWIQHTKVGMWFDGPFDGLTVSGNRILSTTADGLNLHRGISHAVVENNVIRNTGDDGLAAWSDQDPNHDNVLRHNTVVLPMLANGIAVYGGANTVVSDNVVADTVIEGAGIQLANRFSGTTFLEGTVTVARNTTLRAGSVFAGVQPQVGAVWLFAKDAPITASVTLAANEVVDSTFSGLLFFGDPISAVTVDGLVADGSGTYAIQILSAGAATLRDVTAVRSGAAGLFHCPDGLPFTITAEANTGLDSPACGTAASPSYGFTEPLPTHAAGPPVGALPARPTRTPTGVEEAPAGNLAQGAVLAASSANSGFPASAAGDGDPDTYWESTNDALPQSLTIDLGGAATIRSLVLRLPPSPAWTARSQTIAVTVSLDGTSYTQVLAPHAYRFDPATGNRVSIAVPPTNARYVQLTISANTGWAAGQLSEAEAYA